MSHLRLGWKMFVRDTRDDPQVFVSALIAMVAVILVLASATGWHF